MKKTVFIGLILVLALVTSVFATGDLDIQETNIAITADAGASGSETMTISNSGSDTFTNVALSSTDLTGPATISSSAVSFSPSSPTLIAGATTTSTVTVTVPSGQKAGTYTGTITAEHNSTNNDLAGFQVTVNQEEGLSGSASQLNIAKGSSGQLHITIENTGNYDANPVNYEISAALTSGSNSLIYSESNTGTLSLAYADSEDITLTFNIGSNQASGTYSGTATFTWNGETEQVPISVVIAEPQYSVDLPDVVHAEADVDDDVSKDVTITNDGDYPLTGITLTDTDSLTSISGTVPSTLAVGSSFTVSVSTTIDDDVKGNSVNTVGQLEFHSNELDAESDIKVTIGNKLEIDRVRVSLDDGSWDTVNDGENYDEDEVRPGATLEMTVKVENLFDSDTNIDINDISIDVVIDNIGEDGDDLEGDVDEFDVDAEDKSDDVDIDFDENRIDWDAESGKQDVFITVEGEDDNGGVHTATFNFTLDVQRDSGKYFVFSRADANPSTASCGSSFSLYIDGKSIGEDGDDEAELKISSSALDISEKNDFEIGAYDDDDCDAMDPDEDPADCNEFSWRKSFKVPSNIAKGTYPIKVELYNDAGDEKTDQETIDLEVTCGSTPTTPTTTTPTTTTPTTSTPTTPTTTTPTTTTPTTTVPTTQPSTTSGNVNVYYGGSANAGKGVASATPTKITDTTDKSSFRDSPAYLALLSLLGVMMIIIIIGLIAYAASLKKE